MIMDIINHINSLVSIVNTNPMLVAGLGTVGFSSILWLLRSIPSKIWEWITTATTSDFVINTRHDEFNNVLNLLYKYRIPMLSRHFSLPYGDKKLALGYGTSYGIYKGTLFVFHKKQLENKNEIEDQMTITFVSRKLEKLQAFVDEAAYIDKQRPFIEVYFASGTYWGPSVERHKRGIDSVYTEESVKKEIVGRITKFYSEKDWYNKNGIPWKLCILLHGVPGTGKTSLIRALASHFNKDIRFVTSLANIDSLCDDLDTESFIIIEDVDAIGQLEKRNKNSPVAVGDDEDEDEPAKSNDDLINEIVSTPYGLGRVHKIKLEQEDKEMKSLFSKLSTLLNMLDGIRTPEGPVWFMTTNHIETLDHALLRKGRVDMTVELGPLSEEVMSRMFKNFYGDAGVRLLEAKLIENAGFYKPMTGAVLQDIFMNSTAEEAIQKLST